MVPVAAEALNNELGGDSNSFRVGVSNDNAVAPLLFPVFPPIAPLPPGDINPLFDPVSGRFFAVAPGLSSGALDTFEGSDVGVRPGSVGGGLRSEGVLGVRRESLGDRLVATGDGCWGERQP